MTREPVARNVTPQEDAILRSAARRGAKIIRPAVAEPLSDEQVRSIWQTTDTGDVEDDIRAFARAIELAHGIKGRPLMTESDAENAGLRADLTVACRHFALEEQENDALRANAAAMQIKLIRAANFELDARRVMRHERMLNGFEDLWAIEAEREALEQRIMKAEEQVRVLREALGQCLDDMDEGHSVCEATKQYAREALEATK